jgi:TatA/E family protein of Tat protein translocase
MNLFGMGPMELLLIVVMALIVFGPARLPEIMGQVGKAINDFRRATSELSDEFNRTIQAELQETRAVIDETKAAVSDVQATVNSAVTGTLAPVRTAEPTEALPAPVANGITAEPPAETFTNGSVQTQVVPPLADTTPWSWETSGPPVAVAETPIAETAAIDATAVAPVESDALSEPASPAPPVPSDQEHAAKDELLPPY